MCYNIDITILPIFVIITYYHNFVCVLVVCLTFTPSERWGIAPISLIVNKMSGVLNGKRYIITCGSDILYVGKHLMCIDTQLLARYRNNVYVASVECRIISAETARQN